MLGAGCRRNHSTRGISHIAVWYEDLAELHKLNFVTGVQCVTERTWHLRRWSDIRSHVPAGSKIGYEDDTGKVVFVALEEPSFEGYEDDSDGTSFIVSPKGRISVTEQGRRFILN